MPQITEAAAYQALGLEAPAAPAAEPQDNQDNQGANGQEPAQPAQTPEENQGANGQEPAQPAQDPEEEAGQPEGQSDPDGADREEMDKETRRENAAKRRRAEQKRAVDTAVAEALARQKEQADAEWNQFFANSGLKNTITGEPIRTREEYNAWQQAWQTKQMQQKLQAGELTAEMLQQLISQNPAVVQAQQLLEQQEQQKKQQTADQAQERIRQEIDEIGKLDGRIRSAEDLVNLPEEEFAAFRGYVDKGYSFLDSWKLSHMDQIANQRAEQARQQAMANARGKEHLRATGKGQGTGAVSVPPEVMRQYRLFNPKATDAQIQAHYNKNLKTGGNR